MDIFSILTLLGGVGLFLYGMNLMGSSLEKLAGGGLEKILETLTTSKKKGVGAIKGWGLGCGVTGIIQSSAATTIMLIGFVNAGIMKLSQAIPVVFGANVGSTVTAQILRLGDLGESNIILKLLKPSSFAPALIAIGAFIILFTKKKKPKDIAGILMGLGILFLGMTTMEGVFEPLKESAEFQSAFTSFSNPMLGVLIGLVITAIIQSSSASVGILQALSATGAITYAVAFPIIVGQNIGKCMTIILGSIGANKKAKRVSTSYLVFNILGAAGAMIIVYGLMAVIGFDFWGDTVNRGDIANIHLAFNLITSIVLLPFADQVAKLTGKIIGEDEESKIDKEFAILDDMLLKTPAVALEQCEKVMISMIETVYENYKIATGLFEKYDESRVGLLNENEAFIDKCESVLSNYILKINAKRLSKDDRKVVSELLNSIGDFERIGDRCINIYFSGASKDEKGIAFSEQGQKEVTTALEAMDAIMITTMEAFKNNDTTAAIRVEPMKKAMVKLVDLIKDQHIERLEEGRCGVEAGIALLDLIGNLERMASHCGNVALHIIKRVNEDTDWDDMHGHAMDRHSEEYKALFHYYENQYIKPVKMKKSN